MPTKYWQVLPIIGLFTFFHQPTLNSKYYKFNSLSFDLELMILAVIISGIVGGGLVWFFDKGNMQKDLECNLRDFIRIAKGGNHDDKRGPNKKEWKEYIG